MQKDGRLAPRDAGGLVTDTDSHRKRHLQSHEGAWGAFARSQEKTFTVA